jgi:hypothetical protein
MPPSVFRWGIPKHGNTETQTHHRGSETRKHGNTRLVLGMETRKHTHTLCFWILSGYIWTWTTYLDIWTCARRAFTAHGALSAHAPMRAHCARRALSVHVPLRACCARARALTAPQHRLSAQARASLAPARRPQPAAPRPPQSPLPKACWRWPFSPRVPLS